MYLKFFIILKLKNVLKNSNNSKNTIFSSVFNRLKLTKIRFSVEIMVYFKLNQILQVDYDIIIILL